MKEVIDIYVKVVVAFYGFVGPSFTLLISIFTEGIEKNKARHEEEIRTIESLIRDDAAKAKSETLSKTLSDSLKKLEKRKQAAQTDINLLSPKRQVLRIFIPLTLSLFFVSMYHFERTIYYENMFWFKLSTFLLSIICFIYALYVLWQLFCITIDVKKMEKEDREAVKVVPPRNQATQQTAQNKTDNTNTHSENKDIQ